MATLSTGGSFIHAAQRQVSESELFILDTINASVLVQGHCVSADLFVSTSPHQKVLPCNTDKSFFSASVPAGSHFHLNITSQERVCHHPLTSDSSPV